MRTPRGGWSCRTLSLTLAQVEWLMQGWWGSLRVTFSAVRKSITSELGGSSPRGVGRVLYIWVPSYPKILPQKLMLIATGVLSSRSPPRALSGAPHQPFESASPCLDGAGRLAGSRWLWLVSGSGPLLVGCLSCKCRQGSWSRLGSGTPVGRGGSQHGLGSWHDLLLRSHGGGLVRLGVGPRCPSQTAALSAERVGVGATCFKWRIQFD